MWQSPCLVDLYFINISLPQQSYSNTQSNGVKTLNQVCYIKFLGLHSQKYGDENPNFQFQKVHWKLKTQKNFQTRIHETQDSQPKNSQMLISLSNQPLCQTEKHSRMADTLTCISSLINVGSKGKKVPHCCAYLVLVNRISITLSPIFNPMSKINLQPQMIICMILLALYDITSQIYIQVKSLIFLKNNCKFCMLHHFILCD